MMNVSYETLTIGPMGNNIYFLIDEDSKDCVIIDLGFRPKTQLDFIQEHGWNLRQIWITHGHYDHTAGVKTISEALNPTSPLPCTP